MKEQLFSKDFHNNIKKNVEKNFREFIEDLREDFKRGFTTDVVDADFLEQLSDILQDECFDKYSPLKFYWLNLIDNLIYLIQLHEELLSENDIDSNELEEIENELFNFWNESELAESFHGYLNEGAPVIEASNNLLPLVENQIISFYVLHLSLYRQEFEDALMYQTVPELGDYEKKFYLGDDHRFVTLKKTPETFPSLPIRFISQEEKKIAIEIDDVAVNLVIEKGSNPVKVDETDLYVLSAFEEGEKKIEEFKKSISSALAQIKKAAPHLHTTFKSFTHTIVSVSEKEDESYSMQSLPGYSSININSADQVELMNELIHENGHHYLNALLNHQELINDDDAKIYYSPWKKTPQTIHEIYRCFFAFYWSLELYCCLYSASKEVSAKIHQKMLVEFLRLDYCRLDFQHAFKNKRITKDGNQLINMIYGRIDELKKEVNLAAVDTSAPKEVTELKNGLTKARALNKLI